MVRLSLVSALLSLGGADALSDRLLPRETVKLMVDAFGMSPLPTTPPLVPRGLPKELAKRASRTAIDFPAPGFYCGLVNGDISESSYFLIGTQVFQFLICPANRCDANITR